MVAFEPPPSLIPSSVESNKFYVVSCRDEIGNVTVEGGGGGGGHEKEDVKEDKIQVYVHYYNHLLLWG